jgi:hypothetical protein
MRIANPEPRKPGRNKHLEIHEERDEEHPRKQSPAALDQNRE